MIAFANKFVKILCHRWQFPKNGSTKFGWAEYRAGSLTIYIAIYGAAYQVQWTIAPWGNQFTGILWPAIKVFPGQWLLFIFREHKKFDDDEKMKKLANKMQNPNLSMQFEIFALTLDANVSFAKFILSYWSFGKL